MNGPNTVLAGMENQVFYNQVDRTIILSESYNFINNMIFITHS